MNSKKKRETPGAATPEVTVNLPREKTYTTEEVDALIREVTGGAAVVNKVSEGRTTMRDEADRHRIRASLQDAQTALEQARYAQTRAELTTTREKLHELQTALSAQQLAERRTKARHTVLTLVLLGLATAGLATGLRAPKQRE